MSDLLGLSWNKVGVPRRQSFVPSSRMIPHGAGWNCKPSHLGKGDMLPAKFARKFARSGGVSPPRGDADRMAEDGPIKDDRRTVFGWCMYDWANSAYVTTVA